MKFLDLAQSRYTTKQYNPAAKISEDKIQELKEVLRLSPSSINSQPWKFFFISDNDTKNEFARASYFNDERVKFASHLVVFTVIDNIEAFENQINTNLPESAVGYYNKNIKPQPEETIKSWLSHQVYLSLGFFLSACAAMGIDSTPMEGIQTEEYDQILQLKGYKTLFAVAIGARNQDDSNQPTVKPKARLNIENIIFSI